MAKGTPLGFLHFGIDGDNKELLKKLEQAKKEAKTIEDIFKNIKLNTGGKSISTDVQKAQLAADKLVISQNKVAKSQNEVVSSFAKSRQEIEKVNTQQKKSVKISEQSAAIRRKSLAQEVILAAQATAIDSESTRKNILNQQKLQTELYKTAAAKKRLSLIGVQGQKELADSYGLTNKTMFNQKNLLQQLSNAAGIYFSIYQAAAFVKELAKVSGEFEKQRVSLAAIIGDTEAANRIFSQLKDLAVISPFNFKELTDYAKQLSAFSIPTNDIYETTKRLADLSAGLGVDMSRIILAYGQVRSATVLRGQELRQFTEAGIPLVDELAKKFKELEGEVVSAGEVFDRISNRQVSFDMVKSVIEDLTNEGGKFYKMQEIQSETLAGKISNLRDNYDMMLDSIGKANKGLLHGVVDGLVQVMDNWEKYWNILKGIIVTYGIYKATISVLAIATKAQKLYNTYLLMTYISGEKFGSIIDMISWKFESLDKVTKRTLVAGVIAAIAGLVYAIKTAYDESHKLEKSLSENFSKIKGSADASVLSLDNMLKRLKNATAYSTEWNNIIKQINKSYGEYLQYLLKESDTYDEIEMKLKGVTTSIYEKAKAQSYASSLNIIEETLSKELSKAYDEAVESLTKKTGSTIRAGESDLIISKEEADEAINKAFATIRKSPELYRGAKEIRKLVSDILSETYKDKDIGKLSPLRFTGNKDLLNYSQFNKTLSAVTKFADSWNTAIDKMNYEGVKRGIIYGLNDNYKKQIDEIAQKYAALAKDIDKIPLTNGFNIDKAKADNTINMLNEMLEVYKQYGQFDLVRDTEKQIETIKNNGEGWRKDLQDILGSAITINAESNISEVVDEIKKKYKELTATTKEQSDILKNANFNFDTNSFNYPANNAIRQIGESYKANKTELDALGKALAFLSVSIASVLGGGSSGSGKDEFAEKLKKRIDLLKEVRSEYDKLVKAGKNSDEAAIYLMELDSFKGIDARNYEQEIQKIIDDLKKKSKLSEQQRSILESLILGKDKDQITKDIEKTGKEAKAAFEKIEKELSQHKEQYSLYEYIFGKTGDKSEAMKIAFGNIAGQVKSYRDALAEAIEKTTNKEDKEKLQKNLVDLDFTDKLDFAKRMTDLIVEFQTADEKITAIKAKGEETRLEIEKNADGASADLVEKRLKANQDSMNKQIAELTNGVIQATDSYQRLFEDISDISQKELKYLIGKWKTALNEAKKNADGSMTISLDGKEYQTTEKEIANFTKRVLKSEKELRNRNPFKALASSISEYRKKLKDIIDLENEIKGFEGLLGNADDNMKPKISNHIDGLKKKLEKLKAEGATSMQIVGAAISGVGDIAKQVGHDLANMFDALGDEKASETVGFISDLTGSLANLAAGIATGDPASIITGITGGITAIANHHDNKLDRAIRRSQLEVKKLQYAYTDLERVVNRQLGALTEHQAKEQANNLEKQRKELEKQKANEIKKKKTDWGAVADYDNQIKELGDKIRWFYEDLAKEQWGIDIKDWAGQITSALVDAFAAGEDAAEAFNKSVADIMKNVIKNMLQLSVIKPAMEQLRATLFGEDGKSGLLGDGTTNLNKYDAEVIVNELVGLRDKISESKKIWDYLNGVAQSVGINMEADASKDTLSKGIQAVTEDTASLLASYINAMRAEQAAQGANLIEIVKLTQLNTNQFANMYAELLRIQVNTLATANNMAQNVELVGEIKDIIKKLTLPNSGTAINLA